MMSNVVILSNSFVARMPDACRLSSSSLVGDLASVPQLYIRNRSATRSVSMIASILFLAAAGYSLLYLLLGGGLGGAILIYVVAKMLGQ
jgi:hypothetical protein